MTIENITSSTIAYVRRTGAYGAENGAVMEQIKRFAAENSLLDENAVIFGIAQDNPQTTPPESCRYDACLIVSDSFTANSSEIFTGTLIGGKYAVFVAEHTAKGVEKVWSSFYSECESNGLLIDFTRPIMERYAVRMVKAHKCELCVPII